MNTRERVQGGRGDQRADSPMQDEAAVIGARIRRERQEKGLSLRDLAARSGLSHGYLSQVERGLSSIALTSLASVARALGFELVDLLPDGTRPPVEQANNDREFCWVQRAAAAAQTIQAGDRYYRFLSSHAPGIVLEPILVRIHPGESPQSPVAHAGEEFAYVLDGELVVTVGEVQHRLFAGDSIHLRSTQLHNIHNPTSRVATVVSVVTPSLF